jgi:beta-glucosidase
MKEIGLQAYRFSIMWPRVMPDGTGRVNDKGLDFYDRLVDALGEAGIAPWATLFHWDYPAALFHRGGWLHEDSPRWFEEYAQVIVDRLSDRVTRWFTLNEPACFIGHGHRMGLHAPGLQLPDGAGHAGLAPRAAGPRAGRAGDPRPVAAPEPHGRQRALLQHLHPGQLRNRPMSRRRGA